MHIPEELRFYLIALGSNTTLQQTLPLLVIVLVPLLALSARPFFALLFRSALMVLESLALVLPWNWLNGGSSGSSSSSGSSKKLRKKLVRSRTEQQQALNGDAIRKNGKDEDGGYYPGIVNISGTYCFMDSTLQALASLSYLQPHIERIHEKAEALDVPTPVLDALRHILQTLNHPRSSPRAIRPVDMIQALADHSRSKQSHLFSSRQHQDAQELFQLISECIKSETAAVDKEGLRDRGLGAALSSPSPAPSPASSSRYTSSGKYWKEIGKSVFDGLTANRRSCKLCGYTEAVMHFAFASWQLTVPRAGACRLEECLAEYTQLEELDDCVCRKCSLTVTLDRLAIEANKLTESTRPGKEASASQKKKAREARKLEMRLKAALREGRIEDDIKGVKVDRVISRSTKQAMIARPPPVLTLHLNRSIHYGFGVSKNNCQVVFPEFLDLTPFTTSGRLSTTPDSPISSPPPALPRSTTPTPETYATPRTLYRLSAVVCHYGQHSFGHYVCYRRKPRSERWGEKRWAPPRFACPYGCACEKCQVYGPVRDEFPFDETSDAAELISKQAPHPPPTPMHTPGRGWLRISDDSVKECGIESVLMERSGAFMLYYERVVLPGVYLSTPKSSEETLRPKEEEEMNSISTHANSRKHQGDQQQERHGHEKHHRHRRTSSAGKSANGKANGRVGEHYQGLSSSALSSSSTSNSTSTSSLRKENGMVPMLAPVPRKVTGIGIGVGMGGPGMVEPRIVRNVSTQVRRKRSDSVPPPPDSNLDFPANSNPHPSSSNGIKVNGKGVGMANGVRSTSSGHTSMTGSMIDLRVQGNGPIVVYGAGRPHMNGDARRASTSSTSSTSTAPSNSSSSTIRTRSTSKSKSTSTSISASSALSKANSMVSTTSDSSVSSFESLVSTTGTVTSAATSVDSTRMGEGKGVGMSIKTGLGPIKTTKATLEYVTVPIADVGPPSEVRSKLRPIVNGSMGHNNSLGSSSTS